MESLTKEESQSVTEWSGCGRGHWSFLFKRTVKHASIDGHKSLTPMEPGTQEAGLEGGCVAAELDMEELERFASNLYNVLVRVVQREVFMVVKGSATRAAEAWRRIHQN